MTYPSYQDLGINDQPLADSWSMPMPYLEPTQTDFDGGNKRLRRQPGDDTYQLQFDILFTSAEYSTFQNFVKTTLGGGISRFTMNVWTGGSMSLQTVQFAKVYQTTPQPPKFMQVTFLLWVFPTA